MSQINIFQTVGGFTRQLLRQTAEAVQSVADKQSAALAHVINGMMVK